MEHELKIMAGIYLPDPELLGRKRFPDNKPFREDLYRRSISVLSTLQSLLASNYPKTPDTNTAILQRVLGRESARLRYDIDALNNDKVYTQTRIEYLQQILGGRLFLNERIAPVNYNDEIFRDYLITLKDAYLKGSGLQNIEALASHFTQQTVTIKELYLLARQPNSSLDVSDTHKMLVEVLIDDLTSTGRDLATLSQELNFFVDLVRPAHVLYDTKFIWTDQISVNKIHDLIFGDTGGGCVPVYDYLPFEDLEYLAQKIIVRPNSIDANGRIGSILHDDLIIYLDDGKKVYIEPGVNGTVIYSVLGYRIELKDLQIGQYIYLEALPIPGDFQFWYLPEYIADNWKDRFYKSIFRLPIFQEFVKKKMDPKGRFPLQIKTTAPDTSESTLCERWVQDPLLPMYEDLRSDCGDKQDSSRISYIVLSDRMWSPRWSYPYPIGVHDVCDTSDSVHGDLLSFTMPHTPLTNGSGGPAQPANISLSIDGTSLINAIYSVDASSGHIKITDSTAFWDATTTPRPVPGMEVAFGYAYKPNGSDISSSSIFGYGLKYWTLPQTVLSDGSGNIADSSSIGVKVDGTLIPGAVTYVSPFLGHISLHDEKDFWTASLLGRLPTVDDTVEFDYWRNGGTRYAMLFDDPGRVLDGLDSAAYLFDVADPDAAVPREASVLDIGYRYRAYHLHHTSVLNSFDSLTLNNYQKPALQASLINQQDALNHFNLFFSPEFLTDKTSPTLNDQYLSNGLDPALKLHEGTPPFQKTYGYQPGMIQERELPTIRQHHRPLMYSDLLFKEFKNDTESVPLSSVCDNEAMAIKIGMKEDIPHIEECDPWVLFDSIEKDNVTVTLPSRTQGVPNLRVASKLVRSNFILRERIPVGLTEHTYPVQTPFDAQQFNYQLPASFLYQDSQYDWVDFPSLPVYKNQLPFTQADASDIIVRIDGRQYDGLITSFDSTTGAITLMDPTELQVEYYTVTDQDIAGGWKLLDNLPSDPALVAVKIVGGVAQEYGVDYYVDRHHLWWRGLRLDGQLLAGDILQVIYPRFLLADSLVEFSYYIKSNQVVTIIDKDRSRILDYIYVFGGGCPDPIQVEMGLFHQEYINYLDDYGDGIKQFYFNKDTYQVEEHVFSGPVFELYDASEDEISSPDSFPNALVRIRDVRLVGSPLSLISDYSFIHDTAVRMRKKTIKELLPDRTYRNMQIMEVLPV